MKRTILSTITILFAIIFFHSPVWATGSFWNHSNSSKVHNLADILKSGEIIGEVDFCGPEGTNGAIVDLVGESFQSVLGANGTFKLRYVPRGSYTLRVTLPGHPEHTQAVTVKKRQITDVGGISICPDNDGDGFALDVDCNDNNGDIFPGAEELCDGVDNDCDGEVDGPGCDCTDADNDGFFAQDGCGTAVDCNDNSDTINPNASELCDGIDNNCDNVIDEGFDLNTDPNNCGACSAVCTGTCQAGECLAICGNGAVEPGEQCDDGNQDNSDACPDGAGGSCQDAVCGDGHVFAAGGEECDDGNTTDGDGCQADCTLAPVTCAGGVPVGGVVPCDGPDSDFCENGTRTCESNGAFGVCEESGPDNVEVCNGIDDDCDGTTDENTEAECSPYVCGGSSGCFTVCNPGGSPTGSDAFCAPGFHCEDTDQDDSFCVPDAAGICGNGVVETGEECDDGNLIDGDGCQADCTVGCVTNADCSDNNTCTVGICNLGICSFTPISCDDGDACTADQCDATNGCISTPILCDDGNPCTTDSCNSAAGCFFSPLPADTPCGTGMVCDGQGSCNRIAGECQTNSDCPANLFCEIIGGVGICAP